MEFRITSVDTRVDFLETWLNQSLQKNKNCLLKEMICVWEDSPVGRKTQVLIHKTHMYPDIGSADRIPVSLWQDGKQGLDFRKSVVS